MVVRGPPFEKHRPLRQDVVERITACIDRFGLPTGLPDLSPEDIIHAIYLDKKTSHKNIRFILVKDIGSIEIVDRIEESTIREVSADLKRSHRDPEILSPMRIFLWPIVWVFVRIS